MSKLIPTAEQQNVIAQIGKAKVLKIVAGAGCSKTTTLSMVAHANEKPSLYLAFNKAMVEEAKGRFPSWVTVKTTHSLAYAKFGKPIAHKLSRPMGKYVNVLGTGVEIARALKMGPMFLDNGGTIPAATLGLAVKQTVNRFEFSADEEITEKHVSFTPVLKFYRDKSLPVSEYVQNIQAYARVLWSQRIDPRVPTLATHDTYLKLYQLSKPDLSQFEVIYLDESQDTNDCVIAVVQSLTAQQVVLVGDPRQQIYAWRGSVDAMTKFDCIEATLSTSFRFGKAVADVANAVLRSGDYPALDLKGWEKVDSVVTSHFDDTQPHARLYRTNTALLFDAVTLVAEGRKVQLEIDMQGFMRKLESVIALYEGRMAQVKHEDILPFTEWSDLVSESEHDAELGRMVRLISKGEVGRVMSVLSAYKPPKNPEIILTTAHKSKGREFDTVVLADDFPSPYDDEGVWIGLTLEEENLLYVAVTRAKKVLVLNETTESVVRRHALKNRYPAVGNPVAHEVVCTPNNFVLQSAIKAQEVLLSGGLATTDLEEFCLGGTIGEQLASSHDLDNDISEALEDGMPLGLIPDSMLLLPQ